MTANYIAKEILETIDKLGFQELNSFIYATAITCKEYNNDIQIIEPEKVKEKPDIAKWIHHLGESISRAR